MSYMEVSFVLVMLIAGLWVVLIVRRDFLDREISAREAWRRAETEERRRRALGRNYRPTPRR